MSYCFLLRKYAAADVTIADDLHSISMDLAPAYGDVPWLGYYRRTVTLTENGLTLHDETDYPGAVALTLMTAAKPVQAGDVLHFGNASAAVSGVSHCTTEAIPITDPRLRLAWPDTLYRTQLYFAKQIALTVK